MNLQWQMFWSEYSKKGKSGAYSQENWGLKFNQAERNVKILLVSSFNVGLSSFHRWLLGVRLKLWSKDLSCLKLYILLLISDRLWEELHHEILDLEKNKGPVNFKDYFEFLPAEEYPLGSEMI